jgi:hypothetical protein
LTIPVTTTYDALKLKQNELIPKALEGSIFTADYSAELPTALTSGEDAALLELPDGYEDTSWADKGQGATWSRSVDTADVNSWGVADPTRRDVTSQTTGLQFTAQETKGRVLELTSPSPWT